MTARHINEVKSALGMTQQDDCPLYLTPMPAGSSRLFELYNIYEPDLLKIGDEWLHDGRASRIINFDCMSGVYYGPDEVWVVGFEDIENVHPVIRFVRAGHRHRRHRPKPTTSPVFSDGEHIT